MITSSFTVRLSVLTGFVLLACYGGLPAQHKAVLAEAESGSLGADIITANEVSVSYVTAGTDYTRTSSPGTDEKVISYSILFEESGTYDLYVKVRVGQNNFDDDSFYIARGFGQRSSILDSDWYTVNGIVNRGHVENSAVVTGTGDAGILTWKWINISEFLGGEVPVTFTVQSTASPYVFQLGVREDGLDIDKIAFATSDLFYTVEDLENGNSGSSEQPGENTYPEDAYQLVKTYMNPVLPGDHPDLTLLKVGDDFYTCNSSFHFTPYLAISHSTDLVHWNVISRVVSPHWPALITADPKQGIWQGAITFFYGSYWIYFSNTAGGGQYFSKAATPEGPWSTPVKMMTTADTGPSGYDNSVFVDDDGTPYMLIKAGRNTNRIQQIRTDGHLTGTMINLDWVNAANQYSWAEGPVMCKRDGWYYYFIAGNVGGGQYVLRSQTLKANPDNWEAMGDFFDPITDPATPFRGPNHISQPFQLQDGTWWTLSHSYENLAGDSWGGKGRQGLLHQVMWDANGKPSGVAPTTMPLINSRLSKSAGAWKLPRSDYFDGQALNLCWHFLHPDKSINYSLTEQPGWLRIKPGSGSSHILQKDAGRHYTLVTRVHIDATHTGHRAGLYLTNGNESVNVKLYSGYGSQKEIVFLFGNTRYVVPNTVGKTVWLKLERKEHNLYGYYSADGSLWTPVGESISAVDLDKNQLNDNWWVGNSQGMFAEGKTADFDLYFYRDGISDLSLAGSENFFGVTKTNTPIGTVFSNSTDKGGWLMLGGVELGKDATRISRSVAVTVAAQSSGILEVWLDDLENQGKLIATIRITGTGGMDTWQMFSADISNVSGGQHDVYLRFSGAANAFSISAIRFAADLNVASHPGEVVLGTEGQRGRWLSVYPNPYNDALHVDIGNRRGEYVIYDLQGKEIEAGKLINPQQTIGKDLKPAFYQLIITTKEGTEIIKIVKAEK